MSQFWKNFNKFVANKNLSLYEVLKSNKYDEENMMELKNTDKIPSERNCLQIFKELGVKYPDMFCTDCKYEFVEEKPDFPCMVCVCGNRYESAVAAADKQQEPPKQADAVNHPSHYCNGGVECIDAIKASMETLEFRGYCKGNILKYIWRYGNKGGLEDLKKARWYLERLITEISEEDFEWKAGEQNEMR